jgi:hypothetical protein
VNLAHLDVLNDDHDVGQIVFFVLFPPGDAVLSGPGSSKGHSGRSSCLQKGLSLPLGDELWGRARREQDEELEHQKIMIEKRGKTR